MNKLHLKDLTTKICSGSTPTGGGPSYKGQGISFIRSQNVYDFHFSVKGLVFIDEEQSTRLSNVVVQENDILLNITGDSISRACFVPSDILPARVSQHVALIRPNSLIDNSYLLAYLIYLKPYFEKISGIGGTRKAITKKTIQEIEIPLPDVLIQKKIGEFISTINRKIYINNMIISELQSLMKAIYQEWFVRYNFPHQNNKPFKSTGGEMSWNNALSQNIPAHWDVAKLTDIFEFEKGNETGSDEYSDLKVNNDYINYIRVGDVSSNADSSKYIDSSKHKCTRILPHDVLITMDGTIGKIDFGLEGAISSGIRKVYDKENRLNNSLVFSILNDDRVISIIHKYAVGSVLLHASNSLQHIYLPYNKEIYFSFQKLCSPMFNKMVVCKKENRELKLMRKWILPYLMDRKVKM